MASEIRVNTINNRSGLGTISITNSGAVFSGVTTFAQIQTTSGEVTVGTGASVYSPATNVLALGTNNAERLRITSNGDIEFGNENNKGIYLNDHSSGDRKKTLITTSDYGDYNRKKLLFCLENTQDYSNADSSDVRMTIQPNGKVGIGSETPTEVLDVSGTSDMKMVVQTKSSGAGSNAGVRIATGDGYKWLLQVGDSTTAGGLRIYQETSGSNGERLRITSTGNVGINSTNPAYPLDIAGTSASMRLNSTNTSTLVITSGASNAARIEFGDLANNDTGYIYYDNSNDSMQFATNGSNERLRIDSSGNAILKSAGAAFKAENPSSSGDYLRMYANGTAQWDIYTNGELLRIGDNSGNSSARVQFDNPTFHRSTSNTTGVAAVSAKQEVNNGGYLIYEGKNSSDTTVFSVTHNGRINLSENIVFASGQGIDFSATSDASGRTSELLDDYEEGTWTPVLEGSTTNPTYSGTQSGDYTKVGNMVTCWGYIDTNPVTGAGSGNISISGLPFASGLPSASTYNGSVAVWGPTFSGTLSSRINNASTSIIFYQIASNTGISQWTFATASWSSGDAIYFQVSYTVG